MARLVIGNADADLSELPELPETPPVSSKSRRVCTQWETHKGSFLSTVFWGFRSRRCCDRVERTYCDENGEYCETRVEFENCKDESDQRYVGLLMG